MKIYNNELLGIFSIQEVLSKAESIELCNLMMVLPIIFHKKSLDYFSDKRNHIISLQDVLLTKPELLVSLNKRFYNFLPSSINCISLCLENNIAKLVNNELIFEKKMITSDAIQKLGKRAEKIQKASENISALISDKPLNIYTLCGIRL